MSIVEELEAAGEILSPLVRAVLLRQEQRIAELERVVAELRARLGRLTKALLGAEGRRARGLGQDLARYEAALWNFARHEGVEPTNNPAERALRRVVLWRKTSFGSDSAGSAQRCNNRVEQAHQPTCVRERRMGRLRCPISAQRLWNRFRPRRRSFTAPEYRAALQERSAPWRVAAEVRP